MGLYDDFDVDFAKRTLRIIQQYKEKIPKGRENYEVTLLINCLLGLLVLPHAHRTTQIPSTSIDGLTDWGIEPRFVQSWGKAKQGQDKTLKELIHRLRNSVAHLNISAEGTDTDIAQLRFSDKNGFCAVIPVENLRTFVKKFAESLIPGGAGK
jgi:HEPN pEK499 p136